MLLCNICSTSDWDFPFDIMDIMVFLKRYFNKQGLTIEIFKENLAALEWCKSFMKQHLRVVKDETLLKYFKKESRSDKKYFS